MHKEEVAQEIIQTLIREDVTFAYPKVKIGIFFLSVQAGSRCYSMPQADFYNLTDYAQVEIAIFDDFLNWINPYKYNCFQQYKWIKFFERDADNPVAAFVPIETLSVIINDLLTVSKKYMN